MKIPTLFLFLASIAMHCKQPTTAPTTGPATTQQAPVATTAASVAPIDLSHVPKASASKTAYLNTGKWHCFGATQPGVADFQEGFRPTDLLFNTDGTVLIQQNETTLGNGRWAFDDAQNLIYISSSLPELNSSWKVLDKGFRMVWLGNTEINKSGAQIRWDSFKE